MYISRIRVKDYKSFQDSGDIEFKSGINVVVGQNNSGKTALLEALQLEVTQKVHQSEKTKPTQKSLGNTNVSQTESTVIFETEELKQIFAQSSFLNFHIVKDNNPNISIELFQKNFGNDLILDLKNKKFLHLQYGNYIETPDSRRTGNQIIYLKREEDGNYSLTDRDENPIPSLAEKLRGYIFANIYRFYAERMNIGYCAIGRESNLKPDASNLARVLNNTATHNPSLYEKFVKLVTEVIPNIKGVTSIMTEIGELSGLNNEVRIWMISPDSERSDLTISLSDCGTGISQVLAILYVVVTSKQPKIIIIDEPNSFLHPGAAKKLIQILNKFPQHQYFISTHSPEILSAAKPSTITRLKYIDGETIAESIDLQQTKDLRETLDEIGVRFSDVFFSENILWVEGETEEKTFPMILETADELFDVAVLPLVHTDDLRERKSKGRKHAKLVFEIYERLSGANALTPPFVAVILDTESSNDQEITDLQKQFGEKLKFIPRKMYESYLIDAEAITIVLNSEIIEEAVDKVTVEQVEQWLEEKRNAKFLSKKDFGEAILNSEEWLKEVHAAELLEKAFTELSNSTVEYRKTTHSVKLTEWILDNKPLLLDDLKDFLIGILKEERNF